MTISVRQRTGDESQKSAEEQHRRDDLAVGIPDRDFTSIVVDAGAYGLWPQGPYQEANMAARALPGPYKIANYRARYMTVATNKAPWGGTGRPPWRRIDERSDGNVARRCGCVSW